MKQINISLDDETVKQIRELAESWGLTEVRHNTPVIQRCVERVWMLEKGAKELAEKQAELAKNNN